MVEFSPESNGEAFTKLIHANLPLDIAGQFNDSAHLKENSNIKSQWILDEKERIANSWRQKLPLFS